MNKHQKHSFCLYALGPVLVLVFVKTAGQYWVHNNYRNFRTQIHACTVYGPTVTPRPNNEWCHGNNSQSELTPDR